MTLGKKTIVGVGSALVDILLLESEEFLASSGAQKGGMTLIDSSKTIDDQIKKSKVHPSIVPGGSACNTLIGVGKLGGPARFIGRRGHDMLGDQFEKTLKNSNVDPHLSVSSSPTGRVLSIITPDAQRSMMTYLGASSEMKPEHLTSHSFADAHIVHIEGYLLFNESLLRAALKSAKDAGAMISLDLASYTVVEAARGILDELISEYVSILIANEDEARVFTGIADESSMLKALMAKAQIAVLKVGSRGSFIGYNNEVHTIKALGSGSAVDTTGAGDLWAAGFLYGLANGFPIEKCGNLGSACGYEVCQVVGAHIPEEGWKRIHQLL